MMGTNCIKYHKTFDSAIPFKHLQILSFLDDKFVQDLYDEVLMEKFFPKSNDLFHFLQTQDLFSSKQNSICKLRETLYSVRFRNWLEDIAGYTKGTLSDTVAISASCYRDTSRLLCHDDELQGTIVRSILPPSHLAFNIISAGRRIAYALHFVKKDWATNTNGGGLRLFKSSSNGQPINDSGSIVQPKWNSIVFMEVSPISFHEVMEVINHENAVDSDRISIHGWYHGPPIIRPDPYLDITLIYQPICKQAKKGRSLLSSWISPQYLDIDTQKSIQATFVESSSIELQDFFLENTYLLLLKACKLCRNLNWTLMGPANRRKYFVSPTFSTDGITMTSNSSKLLTDSTMSSESLYAILEGVVDLFTSCEFAQLLNNVTGLSTVDCNVSLRKFEQSCYTLVQDEPENDTKLDLNFSIIDELWGKSPENDFAEENFSNNSHGADNNTKTAIELNEEEIMSEMYNETDSCGGNLVYMSKHETLLSVEPLQNSLCVVYRTPGLLQNGKYT